MLLALLFCDAFDHFDQLSIFIKLEQLFITVIRKARLYQALKDDFDLVHCLFVTNRVDFVPDIPDILRCRRHTIPVAHVGEVERLNLALLAPLCRPFVQQAPLVQVFLELFVVERVEVGHEFL